MSYSRWPARARLDTILRRPPTLEVHVPISPTPSFLNQVRCLTHSLRRFGGTYRNAPVIATVGASEVNQELAASMPWLAANGIELRWVPAAEYAALNYFATVARRLEHDFRSDVVLLLDADTLIRGPLDDLIARIHRQQVLAGCIAHVSPLTSGKLDRPDWAQLFSIFGLPAPYLEFEHTGWAYMSSDVAYRYCPAYFNYGVIAAPASMLSRIGRIFKSIQDRLREVMQSYFDPQIALTIAIAQLGIPVLPLGLRYNMPNNPLLEALHHKELPHATILHLLMETHFRRTETFESLASLEAFTTRSDLRVVSLMGQEIIRAILPDLIIDEGEAAAAA